MELTFRNPKHVVSKRTKAHILSMFLRLLALFICVPLVELYLLFRIGGKIGPAPTIGLVIATGFIGASLARRQGFKVWTKIQSELNAGQMPAGELIDGLLVLIGGIVLLTPGLLTDLCGFALMIPTVRNVLKTRLEKRFLLRASQGRPSPQTQSQDDVIDV
jgi:UPF0716 protein FxsA